MEGEQEDVDKYNKYKSSGTEWIGDIPEHWLVVKLGIGFGRIGSGTTPSSGDNSYYQNGTINWLQTGDLTNGEITRTSKKVTQKALDDYSSLKVFSVGALVVAMYGATIGKVGVLSIDACTNQACCVLSDPILFKVKYTYYWFVASKDHIVSRGYGGGQPNISQELIKSLVLPCPPVVEQTAISAYLDEKTTQIDYLIAKKQQLIELLKEERTALINLAVTKGVDPDVKLKPSGIDWLGDIPAHWEVKKLKYLVSKVGSGVTPKGGANVYLNQGIPLLRSQNIHNDGLKLDDVAFISEEVDEEMSNSRVQEGDVLLNITGASIGRSTFIPEGFGSGNVNQHVCIIRPNPEQVVSEYLQFFLISDFGQTYVDSFQTGANREGLNFQQIKSFLIPTPTTEEQELIVKITVGRLKIFDDTVLKVAKEIELLQEYRVALISEVVTGKVKVI
ncbi:restriction endonuclease subunit S [uncultured Imperialibacter sp.]|uniref:restriction endonuclease subunit S n=1 Tax=uncultured Imperialibacter sp. TaxID=1672639 RepID=UPI0030D95EF9